MGFAASQARLLLLTARKSDLEFRAQQITNAEMMLAMQSETIANEYSRKLSNQTIKLINGGAEQTMSYANLAAAGYTVMEYKDGDWKKMTGATTGSGSSYIINDAALQAALDSGTLTEDQISVIKTQVGVDCAEADWTGTIKIGDVDIDLSPYYTKVENSANIFTAGEDLGPTILEGLNRNSIKILDASGQEVSVHNGTGFAVRYYTDDDEAADAEYRSKTAALQVKEKRLQMDLQQVEAQQKACENEIESVKKVMDKNIEKTFKVFS